MGQFFGPIGYVFNLIFTFPIFNALIVLYRLVGDFGLSIIILTLVIKLLLVPLTLKQLKSMKATQVLQPQMAEIRKKYGKDQRAQAEAMSALYKEYGLNPVAGSCLPLLIQMPVLFGLFYAFSAVLRSAHTAQDINKLLYPFVPRITNFSPHTLDLSWFAFINPSWHFSLGAPDPTHILPVLAAVATYIQLRMSQPTSTATATDATTQQMKIMQLISPVMVLIFGWTYAAGLALYWTVSSCFGMVQQYFVTGWGSLFMAPDFFGKKPTGNTNSNGNQAKESRLLAQAEQPQIVEGSVNGNRPSSNKYGTSPARRRSRSSNASARRRSSNNIPKRNASRS